VLPVTQVAPFDVNEPYPTQIAGTPMTTYIDWMRSCWYVTFMSNPAFPCLVDLRRPDCRGYPDRWPPSRRVERCSRSLTRSNKSHNMERNARRC
jgi:hypothetical protein